MRKFILLTFVITTLGYNAESQSCIPTTINGSIVNLACGQVCTPFTYQVPHLKSTTDYAVTTTAHAPYPNTSGTPIPSIYIDDKYSQLIPMAFPFCFYNLTYNDIVVGSNGLATFEALCANANNAYRLTVGGSPQPLPYNGGAGPTGVVNTYYPRTAIMGGYQDIDPSVNPLATRRIEYNVFGTAPCRKFVISFVDIRLFSCTNLIQTSQIVLHESTGLIEVFLLNKPMCGTWPGGAGAGLGILGIQDETRTKFAAAPGKNCTQWSESNTGYRFTPNGGTSNFVSAQLFTLSGTFIANGDTATTTTGILDISFPNICPPSVPSTQYVIRTTFNSCTATPLVSSDTVTFNRINSLPVTTSTVNTSCGASTGSITVTPTAGTSPYTYTLNGGSTVTVPGAHTYNNLAAGPYVVVVSDFTGCDTTINFIINTTTTISANVSSTATTCPLSTNGTITVTPTNGTPPYTYSLDGGPPQASNVFTNVAAGPHTVVFTDAMSCSGTVNINVAAGTGTITANVSTTPTSCPLATDGTITITPTSGTAPYTYSLDGGPPQASNVFTNVAPGPHTVVFTDAMSCSGSVNINVAAGTGTITANVSTTPTSCPLAADGTITITPTSGTAPYTYSLDGGPAQAANVFTNVAAGPHTVIITDAVMGCTGSVSFNVVAGNTPLTANVISTPTTCPTLNDGTITVTTTSGTAPYQYSLDGGPPQGSNIFTNVAAGAHSVTVTDNFGCTGTFPINVVMGSSLTSSINSTNPPCFNINNGSITITPTSGTAPYLYSLNGGPVQGSNTFTGLAPGSYTITFTDANGCTGTNAVTLTGNTAITSTAVLTNPLCNGNNTGSITLNASGGVAPYQYSINAGATYQASATFNGLTAGTYNFLIKDAPGCIYSFSFSLTEPTTLSASALTNFATCPNNDGSIDVTAGGGTPAYEYSIDNGVNYQTGNIFSNLPTGNYNNIKVRDANGCITSTSATVVLNDTMRLDLSADSTICFGSSITIIPQTNALTDIFKWTPAATLNYDTARTPIASPTDTTKYYLTAKWGVCVRKDSITVNVLHKPVPYAGKDTTICYKTNAFLNGSASNLSGTVNYSWSPPDSLNTPNAATTIARIDTTRKFFLTVTDNYGCNFSVTDSMMVFMQPQLVVFAGNDTNAILGRPHQLMASGGTNYVWSPTGSLNNPFIANPLATLFNDTYFHVLVTDAVGCTDDDDVFIKVYEGPTYYLPNAFSPNGDGLNDIFRPIPVGMKSTDYFRVFNRYGTLMFETKEWMKGWDGTIKGKPSSLGTYVWMIKGIDKNGSVVEMKGTVILVR